MPNASPTLPGVSRLICLASEQYPRYSEADVARLADGRLLLALARKDGPSDFAPGTLVGLRSADAGLTWDDQPHVILAPFADRTDLMSASFCRSPRGLHLFFLARGKHPTRDTLVYQTLSTDDGQTWSDPARVSPRDGYHIVNNARVIRTSHGRILIPAAFVPGDIRKLYDHQRVLCLYSDDDGQTWRESNELSLDAKPLMEPGIAECADGSLYMTIRTSLGHVYEARSADAGATWTDLRSTGLTAPAAPSTVTRAPDSDDLWLFWCDRPATAKWKGRSRQVVAVSHDHGRTWDTPRPIEDNPQHSYGYISVTPVHPDHILLTYYDWTDRGQRDFLGTDLRQRLIPLDFFRNRPTPPVFQKSSPHPVLTADQPWEGPIVSLNSGLLPSPDTWRAFYTNGTLDPHGESLRVCYAESTDQGLTWTKPPRPDAPTPDTNVVLPPNDDAAASCYHASVHRTGDQTAVAYVWRRAPHNDSALHRYTLSPDFRTLTPDPARPLIASHNANPDIQRLAGPGRISNDAFDLLHNPHDNSWDYFAARVQPATDPRTVVKADNAAGLLRLIARATSPDGLRFSPTDVVLRPDYDAGDPLDTQFYAIQLLRYRGFYLGLLHTFHARAQTIQPEWAWSHTGDAWSRTHTPCIPLGDEGAFDSRMILFGSLALTADHLVWLYTGYDRPHNAFRHTPLRSSVGRATLPLSTLNTWLDTLPQP